MLKIDFNVIYKPDFEDTPHLRLGDVLVSQTSDGILIQEVSVPSPEHKKGIPILDPNGFVNLEWSRRSAYLNQIIGGMLKVFISEMVSEMSEKQTPQMKSYRIPPRKMWHYHIVKRRLFKPHLRDHIVKEFLDDSGKIKPLIMRELCNPRITSFILVVPSTDWNGRYADFDACRHIFKSVMSGELYRTSSEAMDFLVWDATTMAELLYNEFRETLKKVIKWWLDSPPF